MSLESRRFVATSFMLSLLPLQAFAADVTWNEPDATHRLEQRALSVDSELTRDSKLIMPFFIDGQGKASLFALRNITASTISVRYTFTLADGGWYETVAGIGPRRTVTVNLADLDFPVVEAGASYGFVEFQVVNGAGQAISNRALAGDYFIVDPFDNFASGGSLIRASELCRKFTTRFADGGVFDGTTFTVLMPNRGSLSNQTVIDFKIYSEAGTLTDSGSISSDVYTFSMTTGYLESQGIFLPTYGSIEWSFRSSVGRSYVAYEMSAARRFSVGVAGTCID